MQKRIAILGSTGSIGKSTLKIIQHLPELFKVETLAARSNIDLLEQQAKEFHPSLIAVFDKPKALELQKRLPNIKVVGGMEGLQEAASKHSVDFVVTAMSGFVGILPTISAIKAGKHIGLANKEVLVSAGEYVTRLAKEKNVNLLPVDSEHSALFQCLQGENKQKVRRLILTASGGPFRTLPEKELKNITVEHALAHPTWRMGAKITIDCSTLMNKGLEVIEAKWLFEIPTEKIEVVFHPQSIIHSMVEFIDTSILAQLSDPNMILPIQYAMTYPERQPCLLKPFDFTKAFSLEFYPPDFKRFSCLQVAYDALKTGGSATCYMNAANEVLVERFMQKKIGWQEISVKLEKLMSSHSVQKEVNLETILAVDALAREEASIA